MTFPRYVVPISPSVTRPDSEPDPPTPASARQDAPPPGCPPGGRGALPVLLVALATFLGAFLLFFLEPLIARFVLPWFGGSAGVWTTCLLFFQVCLLAGYAYAHALTRWVPARVQTAVHIALPNLRFSQPDDEVTSGLAVLWTDDHVSLFPLLKYGATRQ